MPFASDMASYAKRPPSHGESNTSNGEARGSWGENQKATATTNGVRTFQHIKDIIAVAKPCLEPKASLPEILLECENCLRSAKVSLDFGRPDQSFRNYLIAYEIAVNLIPRHKDIGFWQDHDKNWAQRYTAVVKGLKSLEPHMINARRAIEDNNDHHGTQPRSISTTNIERRLSQSSRDGSTTQSVSSTTSYSPSSASSLPDSLRINRTVSADIPQHQQSSPRGGASDASDLHSRMARLRMRGRQSPTSTLVMPQPSDFQNTIHNSQSSFRTASLTNSVPRPAGPRDMPAPMAPSVPPQVPISANIAMPKPPSPTYSPTTPSSAYGSESSRPFAEKRQTYYDQPIYSAQAQSVRRTKEDNPYRPRTPNGYNTMLVPKSRSSEIPHETMIDAEILASYIRKYNVLLIDVRERSQFDEGHIFATSIICLEPSSLQEGISAENLEDRLILSPESELNLFSRRNEFDLVVYYDQSTSNDRYLKGPPTHTRAPHLRALFDTLYEFNEYKPLKDGRPPALLMGGLDAWIDLVSEQALAQSKTAVMLGSTQLRNSANAGRSSGRQRIASTNSRYEIRNRRLRDHKFLDEKEQAAWREKAEQEQVTTDEPEPQYIGEHAADVEPGTNFVPDYEAFLRKFPAVDQQSMIAPSRKTIYPSMPRHPSHEPPPIPTRPAPAVPRPSYSGQSEIIQSQAPLARVSSSTRQPLYNSALAARTKKIPNTGLTNFGVTCYMNSTLQCLSATIPLAQFFMDEPRYRQYVQKNWKGSSGIMPEIFANVVRSLWKGDVQVIKPTTFRNFCGRMNREWVIDRQQDAKEFFDFLVDCLHEDLNSRWSRTPLRPLTEAEEMQREKYSIPDAGLIEWDRYEHRDYSFISSLFAGQHASRLKCLTCRNTSTTYEAFYSISIEIPKTGLGDIYQCLRSYTQEEQLSELWRCPYCKKERPASKQIVLTRLPQFLIIHFKRFSASKTERARKIHTPVDFPLHGLNMDPFVVPHAAMAKPRFAESGKVQPDPDVSPPFTFDAYGVLRHLGNSGDGGHYVSIVKDPGRNCWRKFDDERHYDLDPQKLSKKDSLQNSEAYIVFYQRSMAR